MSPNALTRDQLADLFRLDPQDARHLTGRPGFPAGRGQWPVEEVLHWAAGTGEEQFASCAPLHYQPTPTTPTEYVGARRADDRWPGGDNLVYLTWETSAGLVYFVYATGQHFNAARFNVAQHAPTNDVYAIIAVTTFVNLQINEHLPALDVTYPHVPASLGLELPVSVSWDDVARVLGQPLPYFPRLMRTPERLHQWRPGATPVVGLPTVPDCEVTPLLTAAAFEEGDTLVARTMLDLAIARQGSVIEHTLKDLDEIDQAGAAGSLTIAARPSTRPRRSYQDRRVPESERRAAWMELFHRDDELAAECLRIADILDSARDFPYIWPHTFSGETIDQYARDVPHSVITEWLDTLQSSARIAGHVRLERWDNYDLMRYLEDPASGAPVVEMSRIRFGGRERVIATLTPARIVSAQPLAEVILEDIPWVRTEDGTLYLMPMPYDVAGLGWGYSGQGSGALAATVEALLEEISTIPTSQEQGTAITDLFKVHHDHGTVLSRAALETAKRRRGRST